MKDLTLCVSTAFGVEAVTKRELLKLGIDNAPAKDGLITFRGSYTDVARCNMFLRTAERVYIVVGSFAANNFDELFEGVCSLEWDKYLPKDAKVIVNGKCVNSVLYGVSACQSITKKAIVVNMKRSYNIFSFDESGKEYWVNFAIVNNYATLTLDTSGKGLHKRGYRDLVGEAAIKETLAAAIIDLSVWKPERALIDPFCGSGTIAIEAALKANNIAAGYNRSFCYEDWDNFDSDIKKTVRTEASDMILPQKDLRISAFDINRKAIQLAEHHAQKAGVKQHIHFQTMDMRNIESRYKYGVVVTNPPYGERLLTEKEVTALMQDFSKMFNRLDAWSLYIITSYGEFENAFGKRADKNRKLYNGRLQCRLYQYLGDKPKQLN